MATKTAEPKLKNLTVKKKSWHRNGITGEGFYVILFDCDGREMVAIMLDKQARDILGSVPTFVLDIDMLKDGNIAFAENSWRGDWFDQWLRPALDAEYEDAVIEGQDRGGLDEGIN